MLPRELLQQAFFLHALATHPARVLPPGKSLLAMMARAPPPSEPSGLHARVEHAVHRAFWDEALSSLSSPSPAVQLPRLKLLYTDLRDALAPLFPPQHPILLTLAAPLPPTSSPLHSTLALLNDVLHALRQRCAPVRDPDIDAILASLASPPPQTSPAAPSENPLAGLITTTFRDTISLADVLKRDLTNTLLGAMSEAQLADVIRQQARTRERELVLDPAMWGSEANTTDQWRSWIADDGAVWTSRLLRALASSTPVTCHPDDPHPNSLPPQLFFTHPTLLHLQNYLQALVVAASLKSLVRLPDPSQPGPQDFMPRVWALLKSEIDRDEHAHAVDPDATKLVNLADEVVRARRLFSAPPALPGADEDKDLRAAVERTLRLQDPVFALLQGRLVRALEQEVGERRRRRRRGLSVGAIPETMRTGRSGATFNSARGTPSVAVLVKGFEGEVLAEAIEEAVQELCACVEWVEGVWGDTIPPPPNQPHSS
ncbi:hypothetical protein H0H87_000686 [Tephrocybe sp. NHM501043]|nr:hypothetical protein H0H87_000686 [Tephrocybe sp. NHM501043]